MGWIVFLILLILAIVFGVRHLSKEGEKIMEQKKAHEERQKQRKLLACEEYEKSLAELSSRLGKCIMNENLSTWNEYNLSTRVLIFEQSGIIIINSKEYRFSDILGYSLVDDVTS